MSKNPPHPELLAPAGNWECAKAAVANGADAIYFGLPRFNARLRADNFTDEDLPELMAWLHRHGVRGFVAMNTLIFTGELSDAADQLEKLEAARVDAVIIQDLGLAALAKRVAPSVELHASTQMTITSPEGLGFLHQLVALDRAVLARELSLREIERFGRNGEDHVVPEVPLEVFVHGALCVAYSGQCLTSESLGQRSANRGECAQACRMPYELIVDEEVLDLGDKRYLLSPQDLAVHDEIAALLERGVTSFKIEGRLKSPEYVAAVTKVYRKSLDAAMAGNPEPASDRDRYSLEMTFSRGLSTGWLKGTNHPALVHARFGKKRGAYLGRITGVGPDWLDLDTAAAAKAGDGVVIDKGGDTNKEIGGWLSHVNAKRIWMEREKIAAARPRAGDRIWKTSDPELDHELRETYKGRLEARHKIPLHFVVTGRAGQPMMVREVHTGVEALSAMPMEDARQRPLDEAALLAQLGRLGDTAYFLEILDVQLDGQVMLPVSALNRLRRALVDAVDMARQTQHGTPEPAGSALAALLPLSGQSSDGRDEDPRLSVLVRNMEQLYAALDCDVAVIYADFEDIRRAADIVGRVRAHADSQGSTSKILLATPRIQKSGEQGFFKLIERAEPDGVLLRNPGSLGHFRDHENLIKVGDFSLNVANPISAEMLRKSAGLNLLTISYDLNILQVLELLKSAPADWFELTLHQHMPMFHMEHCVFCTFLTEGTDFTNCGRPCDTRKVRMRDRVGMEHVLMADVGCRNTVFRGEAQTGAQFLPALMKAGLRDYRIELLTENRSEAMKTVKLYQELLAGRVEAASVWKALKATSKLGVTEGTLAGR